MKKILTILAVAFYGLNSFALEYKGVMHKNESCSCCSAYKDVLSKNGVNLTVMNHDNLRPVKEKFNIANDMMSCHTSVINGYVLEGHVPLDLLKEILASKPDVYGFAVPGMPMGSIGMGAEKDGKKITVYSFNEKGEYKELGDF